MTNRFTKPFILAAAAATAAFAPMAGASASDYSAPSLQVDQTAVNMVSQSWMDVADAYARLNAGDTLQARTELSEAITKLRTASNKDATLGVAVNGQTKPVKALHDELAALSARLSSPEAKQQIERMLQTAGVI